MIRALWSAASGMNAQQLNVDVISNNLANVNTTAFKRDRAEFQDLIYQTLQTEDVNGGQGKPVNMQVGVGVRPSAIVKDFSEGSLQETDNPLDVALDGEGFFAVLGPDGNTYYTRDGSFKLSVDQNTATLTTADGYPVLDDGGNPITFDSTQKDISISPLGVISVKNPDGTQQDVATLGIYNFQNPDGLLDKGDNLYEATAASGSPGTRDDFQGRMGNVRQGFLETSNVQVVNEMVNMIAAQRAYELNSKAIQAADDMLSIANNLRR
ncbi:MULTISPECIES: flagellar basal-body rod protein FlgG [Thermoanaerobacterium]|uniref:Flagellar basal-body rod protein FlgG n=2 Tax=Thermoanaerobacterium TaxID=28895 RepID=W9E9W6_9THEO|nr:MULTISPECIES: flagellar basal-body rod protein FlgG [Thermoanaerobacterium]AFK85325.1 flagellar basal-body rod protein FlgG [Thermoanaerobacterium saccharolyticum JW/SL-YS485]ETO38783.1 flagellar basal-body rod protein FlgG [Thermoanaerobacterium aotearoense SCUT27]